MSDRPDGPENEYEHRLRGELLDYLLENPGAMDTIEGITAWWLPRHEVRLGVQRVARVLQQLEAEGLVERVGDADRPLFRLRRLPGASGDPSATPLI